MAGLYTIKCGGKHHEIIDPTSSRDICVCSSSWGHYNSDASTQEPQLLSANIVHRNSLELGPHPPKEDVALKMILKLSSLGMMSSKQCLTCTDYGWEGSVGSWAGNLGRKRQDLWLQWTVNWKITKGRLGCVDMSQPWSEGKLCRRTFWWSKSGSFSA